MTTAFWIPQGFEWIVIMVIGLLVFGKRRPEVAKGLGRSVVEFKKGLRDVQDSLDEAEHTQPRPKPIASAPAMPPPEPKSQTGSELQV